jgi:hypothetical protein
VQLILTSWAPFFFPFSSNKGQNNQSYLICTFPGKKKFADPDDEDTTESAAATIQAINKQPIMGGAKSNPNR